MDCDALHTLGRNCNSRKDRFLPVPSAALLLLCPRYIWLIGQLCATAAIAHCDSDTLRCPTESLEARPDQAMRTRRETVEHPFETIKARMGATHFAMKTLPKVATEMALHVLAYNLTRVMNIIAIKPLIAAIRA